MLSPMAPLVFQDGPTIAVMKCISEYIRYLDARRFGATHVAGDQLTIFDRCFQKQHNAAAGAWIKRWCHRGARGANMSRCVIGGTDSPFVRCLEEVHYERHLGAVLRALRQAKDGTFPTQFSDVVGFSRPYDQLNFIRNWSHWGKEADFKYFYRSGDRQHSMTGWHNVELFALLQSARLEYYVELSEIGRRSLGFIAC